MKKLEIELSDEQHIELKKFSEKLELTPNETIFFALGILSELDEKGKIKVNHAAIN